MLHERENILVATNPGNSHFLPKFNIYLASDWLLKTLKCAASPSPLLLHISQYCFVRKAPSECAAQASIFLDIWNVSLRHGSKSSWRTKSHLSWSKFHLVITRVCHVSGERWSISWFRAVNSCLGPIYIPSCHICPRYICVNRDVRSLEPACCLIWRLSPLFSLKDNPSFWQHSLPRWSCLIGALSFCIVHMQGRQVSSNWGVRGSCEDPRGDESDISRSTSQREFLCKTSCKTICGNCWRNRHKQ